MAWIIDNNSLVNTDFIAPADKPFVGDSPYTMWRIDTNINDSTPYSPLMIGIAAIVANGAFMNCESLNYVEIPHSCKSIGRYAFAGTALKKVKIAADCEYYDTSFPEDCEVEFYGGGGRWAQLIDGAGHPVIDGNGALVKIETEE